MNRHSRVYASIDLTAVLHNMEAIHRLLHPKAKIIAVIKADAYGHGAVEIAETIEHLDYLFGFATATAEEAFTLRRQGIKKPVLILGHVFAEHDKMLAEQEIRPSVFTLEKAEQLSKAAQAVGKDLAVHIKIDTGMGRIGMRPEPESAKTIAQIAALPHIVVEGIFTHFAKADETDKTYTKRQIAQFQEIIRLAEKEGVTVPYRHCSNSAGIIDMPDANMDLVRAGIILYGLWPSDEVHKERIDLHPVLELKSHVAYVKTVEAGTSISYGGTYTAAVPRVVATIPVGYGDGYPRSLSNKGWVLIHGQRAPIIGRICMDQFMVDVTDIAHVKAGDLVTLAGTDGAQRLSLETLGELSGRFHYEFACTLGRRIPRVYYKDGVLVSQRGDF
ncbi:MAG: alanine racemase [Eubacterium sp.]|nr:alanine racemase [Eubacterium sp.]